MIRLAVFAALLALNACNSPPRTAFAFPALIDLSEETRRACPPLPDVTGELGDLATKDASASIEYAKCKARHQTVVAAYEGAQRLLRLAAEQAAVITGVEQ